MGEQVLGEGDAERAANIFQQIVEMAPENPEAISGLARALLAAGRADEAQRDAREPARKGRRRIPAIARARSALALAEAAPEPADTAELEARIAADPDDHEARLDLAGALMAQRRPRRRRRPAARKHRPRPRLERGRGAQAAAADPRGGRARRSLGGRSSAAASPRSCSAELETRAPSRAGLPARRAPCSSRAASCRCTFSSRATGR